MNSKQDRAYARTAADLERKYNFGKTFAEVFGLISGVREETEQAIKDLDTSLNHDEIFNRLTNYGKVQGIYRDNGNVYINASYIKSGKLSADLVDADNLKVEAANITGTLKITQLPDDVAKVSQLPDTLRDMIGDMGYQDEMGVTSIVGGLITTDYIEALGISVAAAKITGKLSADQIDATNLKVDAVNITGQLTASQINTDNLKVKAANITGLLVAGELQGDEIGLYDEDGDLAATFKINAASSAEYKLDIKSDAIAITTEDTSGILFLGVYGAGYFQLVSNHAYFGTMNDDWPETNGYRPSIRPHGDNSYELGGSSYRWRNVYASNGTIQTSDRRKKRDISYGLSKYDGFFDRLKPSSYKMVGGDRTHTGLVAQDIEVLLEECGISTMDFAGFVKAEREDGEGYDYGLRYSEFIPLLIEQVQALKARVNTLEKGGNSNGRH